MKKYLLMFIAAIAAITVSLTVSSCDDKDDIKAFTVSADVEFVGLSVEELKVVEPLIKFQSITLVLSENQANTLLDKTEGEAKKAFQTVCPMLKEGQKVVFVLKLHKGSDSSGEVMSTRTITITEDGVK